MDKLKTAGKYLYVAATWIGGVALGIAMGKVTVDKLDS